ncbi:MAG: hypothetical protein E7278_11040 [Lachnospiraceae bacterium]|nr:hypothetical protein [Lachnospiraceae bacterium]
MGKKRLLAGVLAVVLLITAIPYLSTMGWKVRAEGTGSDVTASSEGIEKLELTTTYNGERTTDTFDMNLAFALKDPQLNEDKNGYLPRGVANGDYISYTFPGSVVLEDVASTSVKTKGENPTEIGTYEITNNRMVLTFTNITDMFGVNGEISMHMQLAPDVLDNEDAQEITLTPDNYANAIKVTIPAVPKTIDGVSLANSGLDTNNEITWTEAVGTSADSKGASLAGVTVTNTIDPTFQEWKSAVIVGGNSDGSDLAVDFTGNGNGSYSYTFPTGTTLVGPVNMKIVTAVKSQAYEPTGGTDAVAMTTALSSEAADKIGANKTANSNLTLPKAGLTKKGEQIDGNTLRWHMSLNSNKANVWQAVVTDPLIAGLTVDTAAGITVKNVTTGATYNWKGNSGSQADGNAKITYAVTGTDEQTVKLTFDTFSDEYEIIFDTKISASMTDNGEAKNVATLEVSYPKGGGSGTSLITWGKPEFTAHYTTAYLKTASTKADPATGTLSWQIMPSTKSTSYDKATIAWTIPDDQEYITGTMGVMVGDNTYLQGSSQYDTYVAATEINGQNVSVTMNRSALDAAGVTLSNVAVVYDTKALEYFKNDEAHTYSLGTGDGAKLTVDTVDTFEVTKNATAKLQNKMLTSAIASKYDDAANEGALHLTLTLNQNKMTLQDVQVVDDFKGKLFYKDDTTPETLLDEGDYEVVVSHGKVANHVWTTDLSSISDKTTLTADIKLTEAGKEKLQLGNAYSGATIYLKNKADMTFKECLSAGFTTSVTGSDKDQVLTNKQVVKSYVDANGKTTWTIDINNMGAAMGNQAIITDEIPEGLNISRDSIVLFEGVHGTTGTDITGAAATPIDPSTYTTKVVRTKEGKTTLTVTLPKATAESYRLVFDTYANTKGNYSNTATYQVDSKKAESTCVAKITSCSWANATAMSLINVYVKDKLDQTTPIVGAEYGIFTKDTYEAVGKEASKLTEDNAVDYGWTNKKGHISFLLKPDTYYIKALDDPEGGVYELDNTLSGKDYAKGISSNTFYADRTKAKAGKTNTLVLTNQFMNGVNDLTSSFKLYLDAGNGKTYGVELKQEADGSYSYVGLTDPDAPEQNHIGTTPSSVGVTGNTASIEITGLPWGDYYFTEEKTAHGYVLEESKITATVENGKSAEATVTNNQTMLYLKSDSDEIVPTETYRITTAVGDDPVFKEIEITGEELQKGVLLQGMTNPNVRYYVVDKDGNEVSLTAKSSVTDEELDAAKPIVNKAEVPVPSFGQNTNRGGNTAAPTGNTTSTPTGKEASGKAVTGSNHRATTGNGGGTRIEGDFVGKTVESENHKAKVSSAWVHKSPKTNDSWFGDLVEWILTK